MLVHMIWGQRPDDVPPEVIDAWDECLIEGNEEGFEEAVLKAKGRVRDSQNPLNDYESVAVVVVQVNTDQIVKILNPPNKVMGRVVTKPEASAEETKKSVESALSVLRSLTEFAYEHGFHELGYDPVKVLAEVLAVNVPTQP